MAKFEYHEAGAPKPVVFSKILAELEGGCVVDTTMSDTEGVIPEGTPVLYDSRTGRIGFDLEVGEPNTYILGLLGEQLMANSGSQEARVITHGVVRLAAIAAQGEQGVGMARILWVLSQNAVAGAGVNLNGLSGIATDVRGYQIPEPMSLGEGEQFAPMRLF